MNENIKEQNNQDQQPADEKEAASKEKTKPAKDKMMKIKESEYQKLVEEAAKYKDQYVRLYAEFDNARKRMTKEKADFVKYANEGLMTEFLDVLDNLERSVLAATEKHQDYAGFLKGVELIMANLYEMLKRNGVKPIEAKGKMFDPHCHEVLLQEESDSCEEGTVLEEFQKGYMLGDKVLRTVKVKLAKKKEAST